MRVRAFNPKNQAGRLTHHTQGYQENKVHGTAVLDKAVRKIESHASRWAKAVMVRDQMACQMCGAVEGQMDAHHVLPKAQYPELADDIDNGVTLCSPCHKKLHKVKRIEKALTDCRNKAAKAV